MTEDEKNFKKEFVDMRMEIMGWSFGSLFVSIFGASVYGIIAVFIAVFISDNIIRSFFDYESYSEAYSIYFGGAVFLVSFLYYNPKKIYKSMSEDAAEVVYKNQETDKRWEEISDEISLRLTVNDIDRGIGRKITDIPGDVYLYSDLDNKIIRSKIIQFHRAKEVDKTIKNNVMTSGVEFRSHHYSGIEILTKDGMSLKIDSSISDGDELEKVYLSLKHS